MRLMRKRNFGLRYATADWPVSNLYVKNRSGPYVIDFLCRDRDLIVEVDGGQHAESERDKVRDTYLASEGYRVLRFWNSDVQGNIDGVLETVLASLNSSSE
jgi:very-short-patch-repair endonuclease